jgi:LEA14-like dessication related protein
MLVKLRVQNPNDLAIAYNGISLQIDVEDRRFATGVSDASGRVPRYGEAVVAVPVSVSTLGVVRQVLDLASGRNRGKFSYQLTGKLAGAAFDSLHFRSRGELDMLAQVFGKLKP